jgi:5-methylcytosine-specific restriction endonuclease McrA
MTTTAPFKKKAIPLAVRRAVARRYGATYEAGGGTNRCHYCGKSGRIHWAIPYWVTFDHELDHFIPESRGGPTTEENLVLACKSCNSSKGKRLP